MPLPLCNPPVRLFPIGSIAASSLEDEHLTCSAGGYESQSEENSALTCRMTAVDVALLEARALARFLADSHCSASRVKGSICFAFATSRCSPPIILILFRVFTVGRRRIV